MRKIMDQLTWPRGLGLTLVLGIGAAGCGGPDSGTQTEATTTVATPTTEAPAVTTTTADASTTTEEVLTMTFDYLGGGSTIIEVYPDPINKDSLANQEDTDTYRDGDVVYVDCKMEGRMVHSAPGEVPRESNDWLRIKGTGKHASAVYIENPDQVLAQAKPCD